MKVFSFVNIFIFASFLNVHFLSAQEVPIPAYQLRYWCDPYEYPIETIRLERSGKKLKKFLNQNYSSPERDPNDLEVTFYPQWGYDSIRCISKSFRLHHYYIAKQEVTNAAYREFLADSNSLFFKTNKLTPNWIHPDTNVWLTNNSHTIPFVSYYFQHPAYNQYPVVGISQFQATQYCNWLEERLNNQFKSDLPIGYKIQVDLPTQAEYVKAVNYMVSTSSNMPIQIGQDPVKPWVEKHLQSLNIGPIQTLRLTKLFEKSKGVLFIVAPKAKEKGLQQLIGNVAEWTSTKAKGKIYNHLEYIYTMSERLIPNPDITADQAALSTYLHSDSDLKSHYLVKGGSWKDEFHYADPAAIQCLRGDSKASHIGFRTVIRVVKE